LAANNICGLDWLGKGTYTAEGITKLCEALKGSSITSLKYAAPLPQKRLLSCQRPLTHHNSHARSLAYNYLNDDAKQAIIDAGLSSRNVKF